MSNPICPYCGKESEWLPDIRVYRKSYGGYVYACIPCDAHTGCHRQGDHREAKGSLANKELRQLRCRAHAMFDGLWLAAAEKNGWTKKRARKAAYRWLQDSMRKSEEESHIGEMREDDIKRLIRLCEEMWAKERTDAA